MTVDRITGISQPEGPYNNKRIRQNKADFVGKADNLEISNKAKKLQEALGFVKKMEKIPEMREDIIKKAKEKIDNGAYLKPEVYQQIADQILKQE